MRNFEKYLNDKEIDQAFINNYLYSINQNSYYSNNDMIINILIPFYYNNNDLHECHYNFQKDKNKNELNINHNMNELNHTSSFLMLYKSISNFNQHFNQEIYCNEDINTFCNTMKNNLKDTK